MIETLTYRELDELLQRRSRKVLPELMARDVNPFPQPLPWCERPRRWNRRAVEAWYARELNRLAPEERIAR